MELSEQKAKDIDDIFAFSIKHGFLKGFDASYYQQKVRPEWEESYAFHLLSLVAYYMRKYDRSWIMVSGRSFTCNNNTKAFLESGGFQKIYQIEKKQELKEKMDLELSKKMLKEYPWTKWIARIGFLLALILAILEAVRFFRGK